MRSYQRILSLDSDALVELNQVGAATQQNVLAVIYDFAGAGMLVGRRTSAKVGTLFEKSDSQTAFSQRATCGQSCQAAPYHCNFGRLCPGLGHQARRFSKPFPRMKTFSRTVRLIFLLKTSYLRSAIFSSRRA